MLKCFPLHCVVFSSLNMFDCRFCDWRSCQEFSRKTSRKEKGGMIGGPMIDMAMAFCPVHVFVSCSFFALPLSFTSSPDCLAWGNGEHTSLMKTFLKELHDCSARQRTLSVDWSICWSGCEQEGRQVQRGLDTGIACEYCIESTLRWCQLEEQERDMRARHAEKLKAWSVRWTIRFSRQMNSWVNFVLPTAYVLGYDIFEVDSKMFCNSHQFDDIWLIIVCIYVYMYTCVDIKNWIGNH